MKTPPVLKMGVRKSPQDGLHEKCENDRVENVSEGPKMGYQMEWQQHIHNQWLPYAIIVDHHKVPCNTLEPKEKKV